MSQIVEVSEFIENLKISLEKLDNIVKRLYENQFAEMQDTIMILQSDNETLKATNVCLLKEKISLQSLISNLEEENKSFTKVSKLIALENENARLLKEVELLKVTKKQSKVIENAYEANTEVQVTEKRIGKKKYYIDDKNVIYEKLLDDSIGTTLGKLVYDQEKGKTKAVWDSDFLNGS